MEVCIHYTYVQQPWLVNDKGWHQEEDKKAQPNSGYERCETGGTMVDGRLCQGEWGKKTLIILYDIAYFFTSNPIFATYERIQRYTAQHSTAHTTNEQMAEKTFSYERLNSHFAPPYIKYNVGCWLNIHNKCTLGIAHSFHANSVIVCSRSRFSVVFPV